MTIPSTITTGLGELGPILEIPDGMLTRAALAKLIRELPIGESLTVTRIGERKVRISKG